MNPKTLLATFNDHLNNRDMDGLSSVLTDHVIFIDSTMHTIMGKPACIRAWRIFCRLFPDYQQEFNSIDVNEDVVNIDGHSTCSDGRVAGEARWTAKIKDGKIDEWRVFV